MEKLERMSTNGSIKRPTSVNSTTSFTPASPHGTTSSVPHHEEFSNNPEDYDIRSPIGYGSSAVVYNAFYKPLNRRVAIKVIDLDMFERNQIDELRRETQVMALCKHPNVLRVNGAFVADSKLYIVTPYLSAGSCLDIMKTAFPDGFDEISIATILKQALQGLDYLHKNGHIHRDVKAGNLLMDDDGSVLLGDFGVSSSLMENGDRRGMRKTFVGTPCWMAPEVMEQAGYDYKADIWSFGITAIELATGHAPFAKYPPIKVLMLTLSNAPPTLDRESTKHKYSKLLKEMIDCCLQKDASRRPSAEKLLNHSFFKQAKKQSYLKISVLHDLPPLEQRPPKKAAPKQPIFQKGVSWDFDAEDFSKPPPSAMQTETVAEVEEPVRRPRTVTFESKRPLSIATTDSSHSIGSPNADTPHGDDENPISQRSSQSGTPNIADKPVRKSRFVVEEAAQPNATISSPTLGSTGTSSADVPNSPNGASIGSPSMSHLGNPVSNQSLQGLGVTSNSNSNSSIEQGDLPEVRKGRFSVKDTSSSISSPTPSNIKIMPPDALLSPSRSLSSSPVEGVPEGVRIGGGPAESGLLSERKSRFEVHHNHGLSTPSSAISTPTTSTSTAPLPATAIVNNSPAVTLASALSRDSSQSRVAGDNVLSRDSSVTRVSRFSVEPTAQSASHDASPMPGTPTGSSTTNPLNGPLASTMSKRSRFQVSSVDGRQPEAGTEANGSAHSTPNTSPSTSILRGQLALMEPGIAMTVHSHLDTLYRQNEQQRAILCELFSGLGIKQGTSLPKQGTDSLLHPNEALNSLHTMHTNPVGSSSGGNSTSSASILSPSLAGTPPTSIATPLATAAGSLHRQESSTGQTAVERQLSATLKENESLKREIETLKRELDRLRRGL